jgi:hypothetical protein
MSKRPVWELEHPDGTWVAFSPQLRTQAEQAFRSCLKTLLHAIPCVSEDLEGEGRAGYKFDWLRMVRVENTTGERRRIRRVAAPTKYLTASYALELVEGAKQADERGTESKVIRRQPQSAVKTARSEGDDGEDDGQPALQRVRHDEDPVPEAGAAVPAAGGGGGERAGLVPVDAHGAAHVRERYRDAAVAPQLRVLEEDTPRGHVVYHYEMRHKSRPLFVIRQMLEFIIADSGEKRYLYFSRFGTVGTVGQLNYWGDRDKGRMLAMWRTKFRAKFKTTWADVEATVDRPRFQHATFVMLPLPDPAAA